MSINTKGKKQIIILAILAILIINVVAGIIAYLTSTATAENVFTIGSVKIQLIEKGAGDVDYDNTLVNATVGNETIRGITNLEGGQEIAKKPSVKNVGKNDAYVYMEVKIPTVDVNGIKEDLFTYTKKSGWDEIDGTERQETINGKTYSVKVYKYTDTNGVLAPSAETGTLFDSVIVGSLEDISDEEIDIKQSIIINSYAIQISGVTIDNNQWVTQFKDAVPKPLNVQVGDIISYNSNGTYSWNKSYAESGENAETGTTTLSSAAGQAFNVTTWKVLSVDGNNIEMVPAKLESGNYVPYVPQNAALTLSGAKGYNNAVKLLNDAANGLYKDESKNITARSLNLEDIENAIKASGNETSLNTIKSQIYISQPEYEYARSDSWYPSIYAKEKLSVIDGNVNRNEDALKLSEQEEFENGGKVQATSSIQPYHTTYNINSLSNYLNNTYKGIIDINSNDSYWLASRSVDADEYWCFFNIFNITEGALSNDDTFWGSDREDTPDSKTLCPVVMLNTNNLKESQTQGINFDVK